MKTAKWIVAILFVLGASTSWSQTSAMATSSQAIKGEVLEVRDVPSYTYLRLKTASGEAWAAVTTAKVAVGAAVTIEDPMRMNDFESKTLNKKFAQIYFGRLGGAIAAAAPSTPQATSAHAEAAKARAFDGITVTKATGADARTVAQIITSAADFKDAPVTVRARVVKFNSGIMGKNWIHLRDGSGSAKDASNDLLVTTQENAKLGEVLLVKGTVRRDKDFGAGYAYKVLIEDATLHR